MTNTFTKNYQDGNALTESQLDTAYQTVKPSLSNLALATLGSASNEVLTSAGSNTTPTWKDIGELLTGASASDANAFFVKVSAVSSTQANLVMEAFTSISQSQAGLIVTALSSTGANNLAGNITSGISGSAITTGTISGSRLPDASTSAQGIVQLSTSFISTSTSLAATASTIRQLNRYIDGTDTVDTNAKNALFSTSSTANDTSLPLGAYVLCEDSGGPPNRNASDTVHLGSGNSTIYSYGSGSSQLSGTWRACGNTSGATLFRRVA